MLKPIVIILSCGAYAESLSDEPSGLGANFLQGFLDAWPGNQGIHSPGNR